MARIIKPNTPNKVMSANNISPSLDPMSAEFVCAVLKQCGIINEKQQINIVRQQDKLIDDFSKKAKNQFNNEVTIIDAIDGMKLERADDRSRKVDEEIILHVMAQKWKIPFREIDPLKLDLNLTTRTLPRVFALRHLILPIAVKAGCLTVATSNPFNIEAMHDISMATRMKIKTVVSIKSDIIKLIDEFYGFKKSVIEAEKQFSDSIDLGNLEHMMRVKTAGEIQSTDKHIVNAVDGLFRYAFEQRVSDIHIEPKRSTTLVRMRVDGILHNVDTLPKNIHSAIVNRIKNLSRLDMAEKRKPQDGRIKTEKDGQEAEIRISTIPVGFGEKLVMRIMDPNILFQNLENLGFSNEEMIGFNKCIRKSHGIILVTGPTGSGKSTTLYSALRDLASPEINITTIEDPIEMIHEDFNQIAVNPIVGITFSSILRNILRQDPDIIMVGEIRDPETAENAIQSALTGHLVLSTLHTNDATSALVRLLELKVPAFLIQSTLVGLLAQRLVRKICVHCKEKFIMEAEELNQLGLSINLTGSIELYRGTGCQKCRMTGYHGRTGIFEVLPYSNALKRLTCQNLDLVKIREEAKKEGMLTLRESALQKLLAGLTTYQEVLKATWEDEF